MATWWLTSGTTSGTAAMVSILISLASHVAMDTSCNAFRGFPGVPGIPGSHGADGKDGPKGMKGDPGESGLGVKGLKGELGEMGPPGRSGLPGDPGQAGPEGPPGKPGFKGSPSSVVSTTGTSYFSYKRNTGQPPSKHAAMHFDGQIVPGLNQSLEGDSLTDGEFTCTIQGMYFFTYHVSAKNLICLYIKKGEETMMSFCDSSAGFLVTSGSVVMELMSGDKVALQLAEYNSIINKEERADNTLTGILLFPTA
ncbi:hypothetical protein DPEC_G00229720 [Dallia pectoralis]|uniref:Uncharacterized protein n=1 Tax=Dallia pectoralis TaxID=75939 RepID=A0ACC2G1Y6_DALPE|nr:hypothetical protein DPEC_G00229720 [Dallia pectoralis]